MKSLKLVTISRCEAYGCTVGGATLTGQAPSLVYGELLRLCEPQMQVRSRITVDRVVIDSVLLSFAHCIL